MRKSLLLNNSSPVVSHPVYVKICFANWICSRFRCAVGEKKKEVLAKGVISYEKGVDVVARDALVIRRLLRDDVERRIAGVPAPRGRRSAVVIAIVIPQRRVLIFPPSRPIVPGNVGRRAARALRTLFARADREGAQELCGDSERSEALRHTCSPRTVRRPVFKKKSLFSKVSALSPRVCE